MNEDLYERIKQRRNKYLKLPAQHLTLVSAFSDKSRRVKRQILVPVNLGTSYRSRVSRVTTTANFSHSRSKFFY